MLRRTVIHGDPHQIHQAHLAAKDTTAARIEWGNAKRAGFTADMLDPLELPAYKAAMPKLE